MRHLMICVVLGLLSGCVFGGGNGSSPDAGAGADDATLSDDAGQVPDEGTLPDTGGNTDVGGALDAGPTPDSATDDAGAGPDAGGCIPTDPTEDICGDRIDNDCDGLVDCFDDDCTGLGTVCNEVCNNGQDDDGDDLVDCADVECRDVGICGNRIFVTAQRLGAEAVANADALCQARADSAGLGGPWVALFSNSTVDARDKVVLTKTIHNLRNVAIATDSALWVGGAMNEVQVNAGGGSVSVNDGAVWTGTRENGRHDPDATCQDWTSSDPGEVGQTGNHRGTSRRWITGMPLPCDQLQHVYCIEPN